MFSEPVFKSSFFSPIAKACGPCEQTADGGSPRREQTADGGSPRRAECKIFWRTMNFSAAPHYSVHHADDAEEADSGVDEEQEEEEEEEEDEDLSDEPTKAPKGKAKNEVPYLKRHLPKKCDWGNADQRGDDNDMYYLADRRSGSAKTDDSDGDISGNGSASARARARHAVQTTDPTVHFEIVHLTSL